MYCEPILSSYAISLVVLRSMTKFLKSASPLYEALAWRSQSAIRSKAAPRRRWPASLAASVNRDRQFHAWWASWGFGRWEPWTGQIVSDGVGVRESHEMCWPELLRQFPGVSYFCRKDKL